MNIEFLTVSLLVVASPGTGAAVTIATGLSRGTRTALVAALGCTLGIVPHMLAAVTGLAALLHASAPAFEAVKFAGAAYLLLLAWMTWRERGVLELKADDAERSDWQVVRHAVMVNLLNPKLSMFFVAFLPQFIARDEAAPTLAMLELSAIFMAMTFAVFAVYGTFAARMRERVLGSPAVMAWLRRSFAATFVALGAKLALTQR
ncbi:LysE family translocator [Roseateles saccharophilus]|uniref:Threonine/homoserine/homoserine lactone efflux protein n=1 Tax=Roseateles saccharophilus TaxID=304 RepID=A0A4R3V847_ROSSA|nr:LysE family translocator [Roseateles saccharophilus]MDG0831532.1 LysE family translocator [Roseateles saccharophilus]TCU98584.1 threonine/homoserine/homoserine lactone efflux protein [Roseateles saccharophilus]